MSTDYLLKDELEETEHIQARTEEPALRLVSMEEANAFLQGREQAAGPIAWGVFLCICSPICLILLGAMSEIPRYGISEAAATGIGMVVLLLMIAVAVAIFIAFGNKGKRFESLERETFETAYGVEGMTKARRTQYENTYHKQNITGVSLGILAAIPIFVGVILESDNDLIMTSMVACTLLLVAIGVNLLVRSGVVWGGFSMLLQEGDYTQQKKAHRASVAAITAAYWLIATAIYLAYSFVTDDWGRSWIVWPVAGVLYPALMAICDAIWAKSEG